MGITARTVTEDVTFLWDGVTQRLAKGQVLAVAAGGALERAIGLHRLTPHGLPVARPDPVAAPEPVVGVGENSGREYVFGGATEQSPVEAPVPQQDEPPAAAKPPTPAKKQDSAKEGDS